MLGFSLNLMKRDCFQRNQDKPGCVNHRNHANKEYKFRELSKRQTNGPLLQPMRNILAPVVQRMDRAIRCINHYPLDNAINFHCTYPLDSDLSSG